MDQRGYPSFDAIMMVQFARAAEGSMFRDILVVLGIEGAAASYALSFAGHFEAHVTAVWPPGTSAFDDFAEGETRYDLLAGSEKAAEERPRGRCGSSWSKPGISG
jgi:hypothetical protein